MVPGTTYFVSKVRAQYIYTIFTETQKQYIASDEKPGKYGSNQVSGKKDERGLSVAAVGLRLITRRLNSVGRPSRDGSNADPRA